MNKYLIVESAESFDANPIDDQVPDMPLRGLISLERTMSAYILETDNKLFSSSPFKNQVIANAPKPVYLSWVFSINSDSANAFIEEFREYNNHIL